MIIDKLSLKDKRSAADFVRRCEGLFDLQIENAATHIVSSNVRAVTLSGPTCSGKTTAASRLIRELSSLGKRGIIISIDDFYRSREELKMLAVADFEGADAIDTAYFKRVAGELSEGTPTYLPRYSFTAKKRVLLDLFVPAKDDIYIFEGIQAMYPEILSCLYGFDKISLFICVNEELKISDALFSPNEIRLMRRCVRDHYHRGTSLFDTMYIWETVRKNEEANIFPSVGENTVKIESLIPYEIFIVGAEFLKLSENFPKSDKYYPVVCDIRERLLSVMNENFCKELVSETSLLREFLQ